MTKLAKNISGSLVAIVTPMHADGSLDLPGLRQLIDWHIEEGTDGIVIVGTTGESPTQFRYIDWILTVPLMCVEFYLILRAFGAPLSLLWKMIGYSLIMLVAGYLGETVYRDNSVIWGIISTLGYAGILYEVWLGSASKLAGNSNDPKLQSAFKALAWFVLVGWAIYPIGYMAIETDGWLSGVLDVKNMDLIYNIGDAVNKIGFGLVIYSLAVGSSKSNA
jgi:bacteriorhodopsin